MRLELQLPNGSWRRFRAIVDTGADQAALDVGLAPIFGISKNRLQKTKATVVGGRVTAWNGSPAIRARISPLTNVFEIRPTFVQTRWSVRFRKWMFHLRLPEPTVLGRKDFMEAWDVILSEREQAFILVWAGITGIWEPDAGVDLEPQEPEQHQ